MSGVRDLTKRSQFAAIYTHSSVFSSLVSRVLTLLYVYYWIREMHS